MPFGLYLHYPFCRNRCSYCDFYKEIYDADIEKSFYNSLMTETALVAESWPSSDVVISSLFIGGGTGSLTSLDLLADWLDLVRDKFHLPDGVEFSIECNPENVTAEKLERLKELGVNRPLFGIQSFRPDLLKLLDRQHDPTDSQRAIYLANAVGFENFGIDLIFGLPGQTSRMLSGDLDQAIELNPPHISFYQLTVEEGTALAAKVESGKLQPADEALMLAMYKGGSARMEDGGYSRYEVCSFAREGFECRHNIAYWSGGDYLGLGPSAHSFVNSVRFANVSNLHEYNSSLKSEKLPRTIDESGIEQRMIEAVMLGLRMTEGVDRKRFAERFDCQVETRFDRAQYDLLVQSGHLIPDRGKIRLSDDGLILADEITRRLLI
ncbi:MAG: radical SAM family heme chaperone HemW [candidate division Zixibacteria bacterium]